MTLEDLAAAQTAQVDRSLPTNTTSLRRAVVTDDSPFTISMNGVSIVGATKSPRYYPVVNDVVLVLMDGAAPYVLESVSSGWVLWSLSSGVTGATAGVDGNASRFFEYRLDGDMCDYRFEYVIGNSTSWAVSTITMKLPFAPATGPSVAHAIGRVIGTDASTGFGVAGEVIGINASGATMTFAGPGNWIEANQTSFFPWFAGTSGVGGSSWPFSAVAAPTNRQSWTVNDKLSGYGRYRIA